MNQGNLNLGLIGLMTGNVLACEEPQVRMENLGVRALSDTELLALALGLSAGPTESLVAARRILAETGSVAGLANWLPADYKRCAKVRLAKARQMAAMVEIGRRMLADAIEAPILNRPELIAQFMRATVTGLEIEKFWVLCLNRKNRLKRMVEVTSGTATSSLAHPREVFRAAIRESATAVVCVHNHPSGDPAPSAADVQVTRQLRDAAKAIDIELLDHVIVGVPANDPQGRGYYSFREAGVV